MARRYEFYVLVANTISHSFTALTREILCLPREHKIHIFSPPCNILYILLLFTVAITFSVTTFSSDKVADVKPQILSLHLRDVVEVFFFFLFVCQRDVLFVSSRLYTSPSNHNKPDPLSYFEATMTPRCLQMLRLSKYCKRMFLEDCFSEPVIRFTVSHLQLLCKCMNV